MWSSVGGWFGGVFKALFTPEKSNFQALYDEARKMREDYARDKEELRTALADERKRNDEAEERCKARLQKLAQNVMQLRLQVAEQKATIDALKRELDDLKADSPHPTDGNS